ncbi:MAG: trypsin-like peptidase domain-containing protein [Chloroflexota bacterium]|nr:trypsin-like peptidase domain-containing protein [Chloroflexota bacterium]
MTKLWTRALVSLALLGALAAFATPGRAQTPVSIAGATAVIEGVAPLDGVGPLASADFDGDGADDLLLGAPGAGGGGLLYGLRGPVFAGDDPVGLRDAPVLDRGADGQGFGAALAAGDIDGDGIADAVIWSGTGPRRLQVRFGGPGFFDPSGGGDADPPHIFLTPQEPVRALRVADLDGDGHADLISGSPGDADGGARFGVPFNGIAVRFGPFTPLAPGSPVLRPAGRIELRVKDATRVGHAVLAADFTGDGATDLLLSALDDDDDPVLFAVAGPFAREDRTLDLGDEEDVRFNVTDVDFARAIAFGDADLDGAPDILVGFEGNRRVSIISGFAIPPAGPTPLRRIDHERLTGPEEAGFGAFLAVADLDGDGLSDIVAGAPRGSPRGAVAFLAGADRDPLIGAVVPSHAPPGSTLRIRGHGLAGAIVLFRDAEGEFLIPTRLSSRPGEIRLLAPQPDSDEPFLLDVIVRRDEGRTERKAAFTLLPRTETVDLPPGWSLQGWTSDSAIAAASSTEGHPIAAIFAWDAPAGSYFAYAPDRPTPPEEGSRIRLGQGLWLLVDDLTGARWHRPSFAAARVQELVAGWNLVMWSGPSGTPIAEAVRPIGEALQGLYTWDADAQDYRIYAPDRPAPPDAPAMLDYGDAVWLRLDAPAAWPQPAVSAPPVARSVAEARAATVFLKQGTRESTGFLIGENRIMTAAHGVQNDRTVRVIFPGGEERTALVVAADGPMDIAVLEVSGIPDGVTRLDWETAASPEPMTDVWSWGFPLGDVFGAETSVSVAGGLVAAHQRNFRDFPVLQTDVSVVTGSSGSPLVTADGRVVGVIISFITSGGDDVEGLNLAVDIAANRDRIRAMVER